MDYILRPSKVNSYFYMQNQERTMYVTVTYLKLKSPFKLFTFLKHVYRIMAQLKESEAKSYRTSGFLINHYTVSLWLDEKSLKKFARSGAHQKALKDAKNIARIVKVYTYKSDKLPDWTKAKRLLNNNT